VVLTARPALPASSTWVCASARAARNAVSSASLAWRAPMNSSRRLGSIVVAMPRRPAILVQGLMCSAWMNEAPWSNPMPWQGSVQTRPPIRSRASSSATRRPLASRVRVAAMPAAPAPITMTSTSLPGRLCTDARILAG